MKLLPAAQTGLSQPLPGTSRDCRCLSGALPAESCLRQCSVLSPSLHLKDPSHTSLLAAHLTAGTPWPGGAGRHQHCFLTKHQAVRSPVEGNSCPCYLRCVTQPRPSREGQRRPVCPSTAPAPAHSEVCGGILPCHATMEGPQWPPRMVALLNEACHAFTCGRELVHLGTDGWPLPSCQRQPTPSFLEGTEQWQAPGCILNST